MQLKRRLYINRLMSRGNVRYSPTYYSMKFIGSGVIKRLNNFGNGIHNLGSNKNLNRLREIEDYCINTPGKVIIAISIIYTIIFASLFIEYIPIIFPILAIIITSSVIIIKYGSIEALKKKRREIFKEYIHNDNPYTESSDIYIFYKGE